MAQQEWLYGLHAMQSVLEQEPERVMEVMVLKGRNDERLTNIVNQARRFGISVQFCQRKALDDKVNGEQHQGVVARAKPAKVLDEADLDRILESQDQPLLLVLDGIIIWVHVYVLPMVQVCMRLWCLKINQPASMVPYEKWHVAQLKLFHLSK